MPYPLPAPCTTILSGVHRNFSITLYYDWRGEDIKLQGFLTCVLEREISHLRAPDTLQYGNSPFYGPYITYTCLDRDLISTW
jgi:hypothetical protein